MNAQSNVRRRSSGTAEFPVALFILFFFLLFPLMDLAMLAGSYAMLFLVNHQEAVRASAQQNYNDALFAMSDEASSLNNSGFARFAQLTPSGGYNTSGSHLYVDATNFINGKTTTFGPDKPLPPPVDSTSFIYEYRVDSTFLMQPLVNLSSVPFIGRVPGLGAPAKIHWVSHRLCEHPEGLTELGGQGAMFTGGQSSVDLSMTGLETPGDLTDLSNSNWRNPSIYKMIRNAGQQVVAEDVVIVNANNPDWTDTKLPVSPFNRIWIDSHADGWWQIYYTTVTSGGGTTYTLPPWAPPGAIDANGGGGFGTDTVDPSYPLGSLIGRIGTAGTPFFLGNDQYNLPVMTGSGRTLQLICNSSLPVVTKNTGAQYVRVIITQ